MNSPKRSLSCRSSPIETTTNQNQNQNQNELASQHLKLLISTTKHHKQSTKTNNSSLLTATNINHCAPTTVIHPDNPNNSPTPHSSSSCPSIDNNTSELLDNDNNNNNNDDNNYETGFGVSKSNNSLVSLPSTTTTIDGLDKRGSASSSRGDRHTEKSRIVIRKFQKLDESQLSSTPAPDVKIGQRVAYKEYYGNEFGTIRWIGRVPQISPDWTAGVEFDNAIGEGDGSLNGRRYFIAKDCFAKFLPLSEVAFVDQHVGRPEPGTMISVMSAAARPGQMISIQRVSTVHVQHCFLNAPHQIPGADILAVNTRLHCQCPNCGPCAHVIKPPRTQRLARSKKNATHMCQFSTYTCCGMESQEEAMCTYTGNKATSSLPPPTFSSSTAGLPPIGNSWIEGAGYLTNLQAQQTKLMPDEYKMGTLPEDLVSPNSKRHSSRPSSRRGSGKHQNRQRHKTNNKHRDENTNFMEQYNQQSSTTPAYSETPSVDFQSSKQLVDQLIQSNTNLPENGLSDTMENSNEKINNESNQAFFPIINTSINNNNNMQNPPSYSPNPDYVNFNNNQNFSSAAATIAACPKKNIPYVEPVWCESTPKVATPPKSAAKVVYRDSIENRYLFPTDDPIDSTLEADLENLSQARYGHSTNSRLNGSKNIFKSLRSLVSCLSAQSNHSEIMERRSENTMKFSEYGDRGTSKAMPIIVTNKPMDDFLMHSNSNFIEEKEDLDKNNQQVYIANFYNDCLKNDSKQNHQQKLPHESVNNVPQRTIMRHISSSSDCGFSSASQNSINFQSHQTSSPQISAEERRKRNLIYNNFLTHLMSSTTMNEEDLSRLRRVLFEPHLDNNCCLHSSFNQVSHLGTFSDETEQILANNLKNSCVFHDKGYEHLQRAASACYHTINHFSTNSHMGFEATKSAGDRTRKSKNEEEYSPISNQECHHKNTNKFPQRSLIDGSITSESATLSSYDSFSGTPAAGDNQSNTLNMEVGKVRENKSRSETDKSITSSALPKAFELKLTLSINNAEQIRDQSSRNESPSSIPIDLTSLIDDTNGKLLNSTVNINITSNKNEDSTEKKFAEQKEDGCRDTELSNQVEDCS